MARKNKSKVVYRGITIDVDRSRMCKKVWYQAFINYPGADEGLAPTDLTILADGYDLERALGWCREAIDIYLERQVESCTAAKGLDL